MDYSYAAAHPEYHPLLAALWPGDDKVDWLLWNVFTGSKERGWSFDKFVGEAYSRFEALSGVPQTWEGVNYTANYKAVKVITRSWLAPSRTPHPPPHPPPSSSHFT